MTLIKVVLAGFACASHGRRAQTRLEQMRSRYYESSEPSSTETVALTLLRPANPVTGWHLGGCSCTLAVSELRGQDARLQSIGRKGHDARLQLSEIGDLSSRGVSRRTGVQLVLTAAFLTGFGVGYGKEKQDEEDDEDDEDTAALVNARAVVLEGMSEGMTAFREAKVEESISIFDRVIEAEPDAKLYLWQRGVSLYYADRFGEGASQFATDGILNNKNAEECIWNILCISRIAGLDRARRNYRSTRFETSGLDKRPVIRLALMLFAGESDESLLQSFASTSMRNEFYAALYLGLYREALGDFIGARKYITDAVNSTYAQEADNYMVDVARVHKQRRGW